MNVTGARLKELRKARGYSQADVAKLLGVGRTTYLKYENGENKPTRQLEALSNLFGVSTDYILGQTDIPEPLPPYINKNLTPPQGGPHDAPQVSPQVTPQVIPDILTPDERECIRKYRALTDDQRGAIKNQIDYFYTKSINEDSAKDGAS